MVLYYRNSSYIPIYLGHYTNYAAHGFGNNISMLTPHRLYLSLGETKSVRLKNYRKLISESLGADVIA